MRRPKPTLLFAILVLASGCGETGPTGPEGPQGPAGPGTTPTLSAVSPVTVYLDRTTDVLVSGSGTAWTSSPTVDFGSGITTSGVSLASPTAFVATVAVDSTAALGTRPVSVTDAGATLTLAEVFNVQAPLVLDSVFGSKAQGSLVEMRVRVVDLSTPFAPSSSRNLRTALGPGLVRNGILDLGSYFLEVQAFVDPAAPPGPMALVIEDTTGATPRFSRSAPTVEISARAPEPHPLDGVSTGAVTDSLESVLFGVTTVANQVVTLRVTTTEAGADPMIFLAPPEGRFTTPRGGDVVQFFAPSDELWHATIWDYRTEGWDYTLESDTATVVPTPYPSPGPAISTIGVVGENDVYAIDAQAGQTISAVLDAAGASACGGDLDAEISIVGGGTWRWSEQPIYCPSSEVVAPETGTYYVRVRSNIDFCPDCTFEYSLTITVS